jgi:hypothetical protein
MRNVIWCGAIDQRVVVADGSGNGELLGAAALVADFGSFGFGVFRAAFGGGSAGLSSATTGLGSNVVEAGVA